MKVNKQPSTLQRLLSQRSKDEVVLHTWQFELARRIAQVLEEQDMTQTEMAARTGLTHAQISALLHSDANPTLATLAKIAGHLDIQILSFANTDDEPAKAQIYPMSGRKKVLSTVSARKTRKPRSAAPKKRS